MKTAFIVRPADDFADHVSFAQREGIDGVEIMFWAPSRDDLTDAAERKRVLRDHGIKLAAVGVWTLGLADPADSGSDDLLRRAMDYAAELEATCFFTGAGDPVGGDPVGALADCYGLWAERATAMGMELAVYLGHKGSFIYSVAALDEACRRVPGLGLKLDPVGIIRNLKADPCNVLLKFGKSLVYFHVKGLLRLADGEIEPPAGLDELPWAAMFGILHQHEYSGYVTVEPHGPYWGDPADRRKRCVQLTLRSLAAFM